jgi:hypothetical protein
MLTKSKKIYRSNQLQSNKKKSFLPYSAKDTTHGQSAITFNGVYLIVRRACRAPG